VVDGRAGDDLVRQQPVQPADHAGRGLPAAPGDAAGRRFVRGDVLAQAVQQVAVAAGRDDTLPMLTGIRLEIDGPRLTLAATDRFRLAVRELEWTPEDSGLTTAVLIPARTLADVAKTLAGAGPVELALSAGDGMLGITGGGRRATTRLLDAEFPRFRQLIPPSTPAPRSSSPRHWSSRSSACQLVTDRVAQVRMEFGDDGLRLCAGGDEVGSAEEELPCEFDGTRLSSRSTPATCSTRWACCTRRGPG
jgi:DNA polymerase-3 subunit beta